MRAMNIGYVVIALTLVSVGIGAKASYDTNRTNDKLKQNQAVLIETQRCQNAYIAESARVTKLRAAATAERDATNEKVLDGVAKVGINPKLTTFEKADKTQFFLRGYREANAKLKRERAANPIPDLPASCQDIPEPEEK